MSDTVRMIQAHLFPVFRSFDRLCREQGLRYYLLGGTMLGAIRHRGFIPWDDDMDVGMPRPDYERLLKLLKTRPREDLRAWNAENDPSCTYDFTKLMRTAQVDGNTLDLFLDVFPLDGCPTCSEAGIRRYYLGFDRLRIMKNARAMTLEGKGPVKRLAVRLLRLIPMRFWKRRMDRYLARAPFDTSPAVGNFSGHWREKEIMPREIYGTPTTVFFEDGEYFGVSDPHAYLSRMYGDYMKIPEEHQREYHFTASKLLTTKENSDV